MNKVLYMRIFYIVIAIIAITSWVQRDRLYLILIVTGLLVIIFTKSISKNVIIWFRGVRLFIKPKTEHESGATFWPFYTSEEYFGETGGRIFIIILGIILLVSGILVYIL